MIEYTAFCQKADGEGTIWIETIWAPDVPTAITTAICACADAWEMDVNDVHCLGIAAGGIEILHWEDLNDD